jgi:hypothetical protein
MGTHGVSPHLLPDRVLSEHISTLCTPFSPAIARPCCNGCNPIHATRDAILRVCGVGAGDTMHSRAYYGSLPRSS